jgi:hypothetical protein
MDQPVSKQFMKVPAGIVEAETVVARRLDATTSFFT